MNKKSLGKRIVEDFKRHKYKYLIIIPVIIYFYLFHYRAMYGIVIAFKNYRPTLGIDRSPWVGLLHFKSFFNDVNFGRVLGNTLQISFASLCFSFPAPILLALLLNEVKCQWFKKTVQTITYMPHFISMVVLCGMITQFTMSSGLFGDIIAFFGGERINMLADKDYFYPIYVLSGIWAGIGWGSIIYLAALAGIDQEQYESARIDGAGRLAQMWYITLPGLLPVISIQLIMRIGSLLSVGHEKILLLYQPLTYEVADVISTYVYRRGLLAADYSYGSAVGLFNSAVNIILLLISNKISKKVGQSGLF